MKYFMVKERKRKLRTTGEKESEREKNSKKIGLGVDFLLEWTFSSFQRIIEKTNERERRKIGKKERENGRGRVREKRKKERKMAEGE